MSVPVMWHVRPRCKFTFKALTPPGPHLPIQWTTTGSIFEPGATNRIFVGECPMAVSMLNTAMTQVFYLFELSGEYERNPALKWIHGFIVLSIALILLGAYLSIRRILRPIRLLDTGVKEVSKGNLKHRVPVTKSDELGQLSQAFNTMSQRLHEMLTAKEQLLRDVSHELRSPLTRMKVALEFVKEGQTRNLMRSDIEEMEQMITHILETARIAPRPQQPQTSGNRSYKTHQ